MADLSPPAEMVDAERRVRTEAAGDQPALLSVHDLRALLAEYDRRDGELADLRAAAAMLGDLPLDASFLWHGVPVQLIFRGPNGQVVLRRDDVNDALAGTLAAAQGRVAKLSVALRAMARRSRENDSIGTIIATKADTEVAELRARIADLERQHADAAALADRLEFEALLLDRAAVRTDSAAVHCAAAKRDAAARLRAALEVATDA